MTQYKVKIKGSGTKDQLAIRLLEAGRMLQVAAVYDQEMELERKKKEDGILSIKIKRDEKDH